MTPHNSVLAIVIDPADPLHYSWPESCADRKVRSDLLVSANQMGHSCYVDSAGLSGELPYRKPISHHGQPPILLLWLDWGLQSSLPPLLHARSPPQYESARSAGLSATVPNIPCGRATMFSRMSDNFRLLSSTRHTLSSLQELCTRLHITTNEQLSIRAFIHGKDLVLNSSRRRDRGQCCNYQGILLNLHGFSNRRISRMILFMRMGVQSN